MGLVLEVDALDSPGVSLSLVVLADDEEVMSTKKSAYCKVMQTTAGRQTLCKRSSILRNARKSSFRICS